MGFGTAPTGHPFPRVMEPLSVVAAKAADWVQSAGSENRRGSGGGSCPLDLTHVISFAGLDFPPGDGPLPEPRPWQRFRRVEGGLRQRWPRRLEGARPPHA